MNDPIKIIHKFKNDNRRIQYHQYIFVGSLVKDDLLKVLYLIKNKTFFQSLISLSKRQLKILEDNYGIYWYKKIFVSYHLKFQIKGILKNNSQKKNIISTRGKEYFVKHIESYSKKLSQTIFSYSANYYNDLLVKKKIKTLTRKKQMDFTTYNTSKDQYGGEMDEMIEKIMDDQDKEDEDLMIDVDEEIADEFDIDELTKLYDESMKEDDKIVKETSKLISDAIKDKSWEKKKSDMLYTYDKTNDLASLDMDLKDLYMKKYITDNYIFKDDNIKNIRNKVSVSIPLNPKYGEEAKLLPSLQYFWSNYQVGKKKDSIMIGQKWVRRNELLKIDVEPNTNLKVYENLRNNLSYLRDSFGYKIKREDDETTILRSYDDYITNNEIFMIDLYNELGTNYSVFSEARKNLYEVYINIYFPTITFERLQQILLFLEGKDSNEIIHVKNRFSSILNDTKLEKEIYTEVEKAKLEIDKYSKYFEENYIIQSIIHINMNDERNVTGTVSKSLFNLYRIFDNFIVNENYPFVLFQTPDGQLTYKLHMKNNKIENNKNLSKWFESAPYGITFKCKIDYKGEEKFISVELKESGRIEYKITWKEPEKATVSDISNSYNNIRDLIKKINSETKKVQLIIPENDRFKYAFINTIQKFSIPDKFKINHNDLSEFSRYFFPYVSLVIEPRKRESKLKNKKEKTSKFGTYLRYKRIDNYENRNKMHFRILYFLRNYEFDDKDLIDEIAKQFNITDKLAAKELDYVRDKYSRAIKKSRKVLKKLKNLPKNKPPGINIDIQGRSIDKYKIRITGARNKHQLKEIVNFMKILIYLYTETYLYKKKNKQKLKEKLKSLTHIARRRNKVVDFNNYVSETANVKNITSLDKKRLGFRPEKGQSQWTRSCQNSGNDKKRRPITVPEDQLDRLSKMGYRFNKETNFYEKIVEVTVKGKKQKVTLRAIKLETEDGKYNYYTCNPSENNKHMYVGFLTRGNNPNDLCMPCCFTKDHLTSKNKFKKNFYLKCIGDKKSDDKIEREATNISDKVYILQDTNKIQEGRFILLPKSLDRFFNGIWNNDKKIVSHYLTESNSGYYFKFTVKDEYYHFLAAIANIYDISVDDIKEKIKNFLSKPNSDRYFTYLNNGDIHESFGSKEKFIEWISTSRYLEYAEMGELVGLPGLLSENGINYYIIEKRTEKIQKALEKDIIKEEYFIRCLNNENRFMYEDDSRDFLILIKDRKYTFPIYLLKKTNKDKKFEFLKKYKKGSIADKMLNEIYKYFDVSCIGNILREKNISKRFGKLLIQNIESLSRKPYKIKNQYIDDRKKCRYLELDNKLFVPVESSGVWYQYPVKKLVDIENRQLLSLKDSLKKLKEFESYLKLGYIPKIGLYEKKIGDSVLLVKIILKNNLFLLIKPEKITNKTAKKYNISLQYQSLDEEVDKEIRKDNIPIDDRSLRVRQHSYHQEGYNLFRLELSHYLSNNNKLKQELINIVRNKKINKKQKKDLIRKILLKIIENKIAKSKFSKLAKVIKNIEKYKVDNIRNYCSIHKSENKCNNNFHCSFSNGKCYFTILESSKIEYINRILEEMIADKLGFKEVIQEDNYYVSDIVDYTKFTNREGQKIIKLTHIGIDKIMDELFGKDNVPKIGKRHHLRKAFKLIEDEYPEMIEIGNQLIQEIFPNLDSILRAYSNGFYWTKNQLYDVKSRNLGYISDLQSQIVYYLKAYIIDWLINEENNSKKVKTLIKTYGLKDIDSIINKFRKSIINTDGLIELFVLSHIFPYPIIVYNNFSKIIKIFDNGIVELNKKNLALYDKKEKFQETIFIKFDYEGKQNIPKKIYSIYYK